jgi:hypothetical protein
MEALTAVAVALLTVYDMAKAVDHGMRIEGIRLLQKERGGRGGTWRSSGWSPSFAVGLTEQERACLRVLWELE